jgi:hypothetical protein
MGLQTYVFLLFGISLALYFIGYQSALFQILDCSPPTCNPSDQTAIDFLNRILTAITTNPAVLGLLGVSLVAPILLGGSFAVMYVIPVILILVASNFLLLPTSFLFDTAMPDPIKLIIIGFMEIMLLLTIMTFVRGGE